MSYYTPGNVPIDAFPWLIRELQSVSQATQELQPRPAVVTLKDAATVSVNAAKADTFRVTLAGNRTLANPTNLRSGQRLDFRIKQDGTGSRTLAYGTKYKFPGGTVPTLTTTANALDLLVCQYDVTDDTLFCQLTKDYK